MQQMQRIKRKLAKYASTYLRRPLPPVIIYQMGKVGSSSVYDSLMMAQAKRQVFQVHMISPESTRTFRQQQESRNLPIPAHIRTGERLYRKIIEPQKQAKFITMLREPIGRNISAFFQNLPEFASGRPSDTLPPVEELIARFLQSYPHYVPLTWFDREIKPMLNIDVYEHPFPKEQGFMKVHHGNAELLILKSELEDSVKEREIAAFLHLRAFRLQQSNIGANKSYAQSYREFVRQIRLPPDYIDMMCTAKYTQHFYTPEEIERMRERWTRTEPVADA
jgi:hypothetical protein